LIRYHPLLGGNKGPGIAAAVLFLELNGKRLSAPESEAALKTLAPAAR
jgi:prophage maintenance system killer protein